VSKIAVQPAFSARRTIASVTRQSSVAYSCCHTGALRAAVTSSTEHEDPVDNIISTSRLAHARATATSASGWNARMLDTAEK